MAVVVGGRGVDGILDARYHLRTPPAVLVHVVQRDFARLVAGICDLRFELLLVSLGMQAARRQPGPLWDLPVVARQQRCMVTVQSHKEVVQPADQDATPQQSPLLRNGPSTVKDAIRARKVFRERCRSSTRVGAEGRTTCAECQFAQDLAATQLATAVSGTAAALTG